MYDNETLVRKAVTVATKANGIMADMNSAMADISQRVMAVDHDPMIRTKMALVCASWADVAAAVAKTAYELDDVYLISLKEYPAVAPAILQIAAELHVKLESLAAEPIKIIHDLEKRGLTGPGGERLRSWVFESIKEENQTSFGRLIYAVS